MGARDTKVSSLKASISSSFGRRMNRSQGGYKRLNGGTVLICSKSEYYTTNKGKRSLLPLGKHQLSIIVSMSAVNGNANELCNEPSQFTFNLSEIDGDTKHLRGSLVLGNKRNEHLSSLNGGLNPSIKTCGLESKQQEWSEPEGKHGNFRDPTLSVSEKVQRRSKKGPRGGARAGWKKWIGLIHDNIDNNIDLS